MTDYLDADLDHRLQRRVDRHVRFCPRCRQVMDNLRATIDRLAHLGALTSDEPDDALVERLGRSWRDLCKEIPMPTPTADQPTRVAPINHSQTRRKSESA